MRGTEPGASRRPLALGAACLLVLGVLVASGATATAHDRKDRKDRTDHEDRKDPPWPAVRPPASDLALAHVEVVPVGRGEAGGVATATVRNDDDEAATGVTLAYELGPGTSFDAARSSAGCTAPDTLVVCPVGDLAPRGTAEVAVGLQVPADSSIGGVRLGVFRQPQSDGWDPAAGEWLGVDGTWWGQFTALDDGEAQVCALDLPDDAEVFVTAPGASVGPADRVLRVGPSDVVSRSVAVAAGTTYEIQVRLRAPVPGEGAARAGWDAVGLVSAGDPCTAASAAALGTTGRWRARSAVRLVVRPGARLVVTGAVWGAGPTGRTASVAVRNLGPDPAPAAVALQGTRVRALRGSTCEVASDATASCSLGELAVGADATVAIGVTDGADLGRWVTTVP